MKRGHLLGEGEKKFLRGGEKRGKAERALKKHRGGTMRSGTGIEAQRNVGRSCVKD